MELSLNLRPRGILTLNAKDIVKYEPTFKGAKVTYIKDQELHTVEVYEAYIRIQSMLERL